MPWSLSFRRKRNLSRGTFPTSPSLRTVEAQSPRMVAPRRTRTPRAMRTSNLLPPSGPSCLRSSKRNPWANGSPRPSHPFWYVVPSLCRHVAPPLTWQMLAHVVVLSLRTEKNGAILPCAVRSWRAKLHTRFHAGDTVRSHMLPRCWRGLWLFPRTCYAHLTATNPAIERCSMSFLQRGATTRVWMEKVSSASCPRRRWSLRSCLPSQTFGRAAQRLLRCWLGWC